MTKRESFIPGVKADAQLAVLNNEHARQLEHKRHLDELGFPEYVEPDFVRHAPVSYDDPCNPTPSRVVNQAGQDLGDSNDDDSPHHNMYEYKPAKKIKKELVQAIVKEQADELFATKATPGEQLKYIDPKQTSVDYSTREAGKKERGGSIPPIPEGAISHSSIDPTTGIQISTGTDAEGAYTKTERFDPWKWETSEAGPPPSTSFASTTGKQDTSGAYQGPGTSGLAGSRFLQERSKEKVSQPDWADKFIENEYIRSIVKEQADELFISKQPDPQLPSYLKFPKDYRVPKVGTLGKIAGGVAFLFGKPLIKTAWSTLTKVYKPLGIAVAAFGGVMWLLKYANENQAKGQTLDGLLSIPYDDRSSAQNNQVEELLGEALKFQSGPKTVSDMNKYYNTFYGMNDYIPTHNEIDDFTRDFNPKGAFQKEEEGLNQWIGTTWSDLQQGTRSLIQGRAGVGVRPSKEDWEAYLEQEGDEAVKLADNLRGKAGKDSKAQEVLNNVTDYIKDKVDGVFTSPAGAAVAEKLDQGSDFFKETADRALDAINKVKQNFYKYNLTTTLKDKISRDPAYKDLSSMDMAREAYAQSIGSPTPEPTRPAAGLEGKPVTPPKAPPPPPPPPPSSEKVLPPVERRSAFDSRVLTPSQLQIDPSRQFTSQQREAMRGAETARRTSPEKFGMSKPSAKIREELIARGSAVRSSKDSFESWMSLL